jgi:hypothetical protein
MRAFSFPAKIDDILESLGAKQDDFVKAAVVEKAQRERLLKSLDQHPQPEPPALSIGDQLNQRERVFLDGPTDLSERRVRKQIAHDSVDDRHQARHSKHPLFLTVHPSGTKATRRARRIF